jgi:hypothetical protein
MQGWDGVLMLFQFGTIANGGVNSIKAQQGDAANLSDAADLTGTAQSVADDADSKVKFIDLYQPRKRYVRAYVDKDATNACAETVTYIQYRGRIGPTAAHGTDVAGEAWLAPAAGTA